MPKVPEYTIFKEEKVDHPLKNAMEGFKGVAKTMGDIFLVPEEGKPDDSLSFEKLGTGISNLASTIKDNLLVGLPTKNTETKGKNSESSLPTPILHTLDKVIEFGNTIGDLLLVKDPKTEKEYHSKIESFVDDLFKSSNNQAFSKVLFATQSILDSFMDSILIKNDDSNSRSSTSESPVRKSLKNFVDYSSNLASYVLVKDNDEAKYEREAQEIFGQIAKSKLAPGTLNELLKEVIAKFDGLARDILNPTSAGALGSSNSEPNVFIKIANLVGDQFSNYVLVPKSNTEKTDASAKYDSASIYKFVSDGVKQLLVEPDVQVHESKPVEQSPKNENIEQINKWIQDYLLNNDSNGEGKSLDTLKESFKHLINDGQKVLEDVLVQSEQMPILKNSEKETPSQIFDDTGSKIADFVLAGRELKGNEKQLSFDYQQLAKTLFSAIQNNLLVDDKEQSKGPEAVSKTPKGIFEGEIGKYLRAYLLNGDNYISADSTESLGSIAQKVVSKSNVLINEVLASQDDALGTTETKKNTFPQEETARRMTTHFLNNDEGDPGSLKITDSIKVEEFVDSMKKWIDSNLLVQPELDSDGKNAASASSNSEWLFENYLAQYLLNNGESKQNLNGNLKESLMRILSNGSKVLDSILVPNVEESPGNEVPVNKDKQSEGFMDLENSPLVKFLNDNLLNNGQEGKSFFNSISSVLGKLETSAPVTKLDKVEESTKTLQQLLNLYNSVDDENTKVELLKLMEREMHKIEETDPANIEKPHDSQSGVLAGSKALFDNILVEPTTKGTESGSWSNLVNQFLVTDELPKKQSYLPIIKDFFKNIIVATGDNSDSSEKV
ncbi:hypothetical protein HK103_005261 [Boothiomyces macroporosus]|uniref:Uncharacterized protein n=1 Tax=Boothiomyces macroporosus TaxID=261099 RepID=A0AAD5UFZ7_9FUNG|nr:hypothetical protein HK103_005241 [Boothiomyces macroporosus]KAJ3256627.1 hypothetical protein HK103_005261 [Boothiomyces macroporosus]